MFFTGKANPQRRVDLRGRSRSEETREQVLERTRLERERRKQQKFENRSATVIQSWWRSKSVREAVKKDIKQAWLLKYRPASSNGAASPPQLDSTFLRELLFFANPASLEDAQLLSDAAALVLSAKSQEDQLVALQPARQGGQALQEVLVQLKRLLRSCLAVLLHHRASLHPTLSAPRPSQALHHPPPGAPLLEALIRLPAPETWGPFLPRTDAAAVSASIIRDLQAHGLFLHLAHLLNAAAPPSYANPTDATRTKQRVPYIETLVTQLAARHLATIGTGASFGGQTADGQAQRGPAPGIYSLMFVPQLWSRCPSLQPIAPRVCRQAIHDLASTLPRTPLAAPTPSSPSPLIPLLPTDIAPGHKAGAAACLLSNILSCGPKILSSETTSPAPTTAAPASPPSTATPSPRLPAPPFPRLPAPPATPPSTSLHTAILLHHLLSLLPLRTLFPGPYQDADEDEDAPPAASSDPSSSTSTSSAAAATPTPATYLAPRSAPLPWPSDDMAPSEFVEQLHAVLERPGRELVVGLVSSLAPRQGPWRASGPEELRAAGDGVLALCLLLRQLLVLPNHRHRLLLALAVQADLVRRLWYSHLSPSTGATWGPALAAGRGTTHDSPEAPLLLVPLVVLSQVFSSFLATADLSELQSGRLLPLAELWTKGREQQGLLWLLKTALWQVLWVTADRPSPPTHPVAPLRAELVHQAGHLLTKLHGLSARALPDLSAAFHADGLQADRLHAEATSSARTGGLEGSSPSRIWAILRTTPCLFPFEDRARIFQSIVAADREEHLESELAASRASPGFPPPRRNHVTIRRSQLLHDAFDGLGRAGEALKGRIRIEFIDEHGIPEAGIDGGGLFKDFMEALIKQGFSPEYGLFKANPSQQLYPNPAAIGVIDEAPAMISFLGAMLGKALYEGVLCELPFAPFFLKKVGGGWCDLNDLPSLDPELHRHLAALRHHPGDISALSLTFSASRDRFGRVEVVELKPGGADVEVTADNVVEYVHRMANFQLNQQLHIPTQAFLQGLHTVIQPAWLRMFNAAELQELISGKEGGLDLADLQEHIQYAGGYHRDHPVVANLWKALESFSVKDQQAFLKFVTSCSRPPLLGFKYLEPQLCVQMVGHVGDAEALERLPTAATCINLLKLPPYPSLQLMRAKLLYSINAGAGFDLS